MLCCITFEIDDELPPSSKQIVPEPPAHDPEEIDNGALNAAKTIDRIAAGAQKRTDGNSGFDSFERGGCDGDDIARFATARS